MGEQFSVAWRVLDAQYWFLAQRRRTIFLVADFGGQTAPQILFEQDCLLGNFKVDESQGQGASACSEESAGTAGYGKTEIGYWREAIQSLRAEGENRPSRPSSVITGNQNDPIAFACNQRDEVRNLNDISGVDCRDGKENGDLCGTLQSHQSGGYSLNTLHPVRIGKYVRRLTPLECEHLMGYPDGWTQIDGAADSARYKALGNSVAIPCVEFVLRGISYFLRKFKKSWNESECISTPTT